MANPEDSDSQLDASAINDELVQTIRRVREAAAAAEQQNNDLKEQQPQIERRSSNAEIQVELPGDQESQASETENKSAPLDELSLDNEADDENRDKR